MRQDEIKLTSWKPSQSSRCWFIQAYHFPPGRDFALYVGGVATGERRELDIQFRLGGQAFVQTACEMLLLHTPASGDLGLGFERLRDRLLSSPWVHSFGAFHLGDQNWQPTVVPFSGETQFEYRGYEIRFTGWKEASETPVLAAQWVAWPVGFAVTKEENKSRSWTRPWLVSQCSACRPFSPHAQTGLSGAYVRGECFVDPLPGKFISLPLQCGLPTVIRETPEHVKKALSGLGQLSVVAMVDATHTFCSDRNCDWQEEWNHKDNEAQISLRECAQKVRHVLSSHHRQAS